MYQEILVFYAMTDNKPLIEVETSVLSSLSFLKKQQQKKLVFETLTF